MFVEPSTPLNKKVTAPARKPTHLITLSNLC